MHETNIIRSWRVHNEFAFVFLNCVPFSTSEAGKVNHRHRRRCWPHARHLKTLISFSSLGIAFWSICLFHLFVFSTLLLSLLLLLLLRLCRRKPYLLKKWNEYIYILCQCKAKQTNQNKTCIYDTYNIQYVHQNTKIILYVFCLFLHSTTIARASSILYSIYIYMYSITTCVVIILSVLLLLLLSTWINETFSIDLHHIHI